MRWINSLFLGKPGLNSIPLTQKWPTGTALVTWTKTG